MNHMQETILNGTKDISIDSINARMRPSITIAIDASRSRSGGAKGHLLGLLNTVDPRHHGIAIIHVWSYKKLLEALPDVPWLIKHSPPELNRSLLHQLFWQYRTLPRELAKVGCDILLSTDAGTVCRFAPSVVMSRDMLSFEGKEMQRYSLLSFARLRLFLLKNMQVSSLRYAKGVIFLTQYASSVIQRFTGKLQFVQVIPHGIGERFRQQAKGGQWREPVESIKCVYVSNADMYKHQWWCTLSLDCEKRVTPFCLSSWAEERVARRCCLRIQSIRWIQRGILLRHLTRSHTTKYQVTLQTPTFLYSHRVAKTCLIH